MRFSAFAVLATALAVVPTTDAWWSASFHEQKNLKTFHVEYRDTNGRPPPDSNCRADGFLRV
jgi:hypothetical protein